MSNTGPNGHIRFTGVLRNRTVRVLTAADLQSIAGDQFARVALSVLVFDRTGSAAATVLTYAATFLPAIVGGTLLARVADRVAPGVVMIGCDLVRALLFAAMAAPGLGVAPLVALIVVAALFGPVFSSAQTSHLAAVLDRRVYESALGVRVASWQLAQVLGFAIGGVVVRSVGPRGALAINAASFVVSALLVRIAVRRGGSASTARPRPVTEPPSSAASWFWRSSERRALLALAALAGLFIAPEGLVVPYAAGVGAGSWGLGLLFAAVPLGGVVGAALLVRLVPNGRRARAAGVLAVACGLPLLLSAVQPMWPIAAFSWALCGALLAYQVPIFTSIAQAAPQQWRARITGFANAVLMGAQGVGLILAGAAAARWSSGVVIALAGAAGSISALCLIAGPLRAWTAPVTIGPTTAEAASP